MNVSEWLSVYECLSVSPVTIGYTPPRAHSSWDRLQPPTTFNKKKAEENVLTCANERFLNVSAPVTQNFEFPPICTYAFSKEM